MRSISAIASPVLPVVARDLHRAVLPTGLDERAQRDHAARLVAHVQHQDALGRHAVTHVRLHHHALQAPGVGEVIDGGGPVGRRDRRADRVEPDAQRFRLLAVDVQAQLRRVRQAFHHGVGDYRRTVGLGQQLVARIRQGRAAQAAAVLQAQREAAAEAAQDRGRVGHAPVQQQQVPRAGPQRNARVQLLLEAQRHLVAEDVAQHTAEGTGQHARDQHDGR
ncbi:hypothetical protein G6F50_014862 [Rhizopus delemar]|uniref:Uncharacterized protein n=1 Tax=Rhizopus delemar TaxID=936053 RepID=A0A9P6Y1P4_9FUNG|nr:hypothetical protein G6F50_014862 [Rhizopus delemar]